MCKKQKDFLENIDPVSYTHLDVYKRQEYEASEIAGKSGKLEIHLSIKENTACKGDFYDRYVLQASLTLDTEICENIGAPDATIANVGSDKQLTYTVLPGKGLATSIKADVKDFEMESISINGIRLNLNIEIDDAEPVSYTHLLGVSRKTFYRMLEKYEAFLK